MYIMTEDYGCMGNVYERQWLSLHFLQQLVLVCLRAVNRPSRSGAVIALSAIVHLALMYVAADSSACV